jgi:hypothetical protein
MEHANQWLFKSNHHWFQRAQDAKRKSSAKGNTNASKENSGGSKVATTVSKEHKTRDARAGKAGVSSGTLSSSSSKVATTGSGENKTRNARADKAGVSSGTMAKAETLRTALYRPNKRNVRNQLTLSCDHLQCPCAG